MKLIITAILGLLVSFSAIAADLKANPTVVQGDSIVFLKNKYKTQDGLFQFGTMDAFARPQLWFNAANNVLRLGSINADGDPTNVASEGLVVYDGNLEGDPMDAGNYGFARIKPGRFGFLSCSSTTGLCDYAFRVDGTSLFLRNDSSNKSFEVDRNTGAITTSLGSGVVQSDSSGNLTSSDLEATNIGNDSSIVGVTVKDALNTVANMTSSVTKVLWVDKNRADSYTANGSIGRPFKTITEAAAVASTGQTIKIYQGTYDGDVVLPAGVSIEGFATNNTVINGNLGTTSGAPISIRFVTIPQGKTLTINGTATSILDCFNNGSTVVNDSFIQAYNFHQASTASGVVALTINGATSKFQSIMATISSTGDASAIVLNAGTLILQTVQVSGSSATATILDASASGQAVLLNSYVLNMGGGAAANLANGATTAPNMLNGVFAVGNVSAGTAYTVVEGLNITGTMSGSNLIFRPSSMVGYTPAAGANWVDPDPTTVQSALDRLAAAVSGGGATPIP